MNPTFVILLENRASNRANTSLICTHVFNPSFSSLYVTPDMKYKPNKISNDWQNIWPFTNMLFKKVFGPCFANSLDCQMPDDRRQLIGDMTQTSCVYAETSWMVSVCRRRSAWLRMCSSSVPGATPAQLDNIHTASDLILVSGDTIYWESNDSSLLKEPRHSQ